MTDKVTYYAVIDEDSSRERPRTAFRRVENDEGQIDELFTRDLSWERSSLLHAANRGDTMLDFIPITEQEAARIVERVRAEATQDEAEQ
jgi:hypothetical protein